MQLILTPELILHAYGQGIFPMAAGMHSHGVHWLCPAMRGQLPIRDFHLPRRLQKTLVNETIRAETLQIRINTAFSDVVTGCATATPKRPDTWINDSIRAVFAQLHAQGHAHSIEAWHHNELVAGLYGLALHGAFFAESMFTRRRDASKIVLAYLAARLWAGGFSMLDTQFLNAHLQQFGGYEIPYPEFQARLNEALAIKADFACVGHNPQAIMRDFLALPRG